MRDGNGNRAAWTLATILAAIVIGLGSFALLSAAGQGEAIEATHTTIANLRTEMIRRTSEQCPGSRCEQLQRDISNNTSAIAVNADRWQRILTEFEAIHGELKEINVKIGRLAQ